MRRTRPVRSAAALLWAALVLAGCQATGSGGLGRSHAPSDLSPAAASAIAGDMAGRLAEVVGPGTATIRLEPDRSSFGEALEASLRGWGYAVVAGGDRDTEGTTVPVNYRVEPFEGQYLARLSLPQVEIGRAYAATPAGATPASPASIMRRD